MKQVYELQTDVLFTVATLPVFTGALEEVRIFCVSMSFPYFIRTDSLMVSSKLHVSALFPLNTYQTSRPIFMKPGTNIMLLEATPPSYFMLF
jgi:hypothetical protein